MVDATKRGSRQCGRTKGEKKGIHGSAGEPKEEQWVAKARQAIQNWIEGDPKLNKPQSTIWRPISPINKFELNNVYWAKNAFYDMNEGRIGLLQHKKGGKRTAFIFPSRRAKVLDCHLRRRGQQISKEEQCAKPIEGRPTWWGASQFQAIEERGKRPTRQLQAMREGAKQREPSRFKLWAKPIGQYGRWAKLITAKEGRGGKPNLPRLKLFGPNCSL